MKYTELFKLKQIIGNMIVSNLPHGQKLLFYSLLDQGDSIFKNLNKYKATENNIPLTPEGNLDVSKLFAQKTAEFKKEFELSDDPTKDAEKKASDYIEKMWNKFAEDDQAELLEPIADKYFNFLNETEFALITKPREIKTMIADEAGRQKSEKTDWFLTTDQERFLSKFLTIKKQETKKPDKKK